MPSRCALVVPVPASSASGRAAVSSRIGGVSPLAHCIRAAPTAAAAIGPVVVAVAENLLVDVEASLAAHGLLSSVSVVAVPGTGSRSECLRAALDELGTSAHAPRCLVVHDLHHALASTDVSQRVVRALLGGSDFVLPVLPMVDSVKDVDPAGTVRKTVDRASLRSAQFPRGFSVGWLAKGLAAMSDDAFDELSYAVKGNSPIEMVPGDSDAFRIDLSRDTALADAIVSLRLVGRR